MTSTSSSLSSRCQPANRHVASSERADPTERAVQRLPLQLGAVDDNSGNYDPWLNPVFMGTAVHKATAEELWPQFAYRTVGPDFLEKETGTMVELTTPGQVGAHVARGGDYVNALYATYRFGHLLAE